ncbi:MAG TPA: DUF3761 domain-containing protein [Gemmatimonadaceae bacterium]|nr:DUF3761 domain-containing protein [Gemmatimonadaceae bacterium]
MLKSIEVLKTLSSVVCGAAFVVVAASSSAHAQTGGKTRTDMPHSTTARCTDGTWSSAGKQQGACSKHGGVAKWIGKAPRGATARCKDGEYWTTPERQGACSGHDGVAYWLGKNKK